MLEKRKDYAGARKDVEMAMKQPGAEKDANLATLLKRIEILVKREKEKEKKMAGKMFG